jgi:hypothetical protein
VAITEPAQDNRCSEERTMDADLQEMLEHYRITKLVNEYCHGCDRGDGPRMGSVYAEDSWDDHGMYLGDGKAFADSVMEGRRQRGEVMSHHLGQTLVKIDGDTAGAETYFVATMAFPDAGEGEEVHHLGGRYVDHLVREDGRWLIKERLTVRDWSIGHKVERDYFREMNFIPGTTDGSDVSFRALGLVHSGGFGPSAPSPTERRKLAESV